MIILDIETSGLTNSCGIWQIGAINLNSPRKYFFQDSRIDDEDIIQDGALKVTGINVKKLKDKNKQTQKQMISNYLEWVGKQRRKMFFGQNIGWDVSMVEARCIKYGIEKRFLEVHKQRSMDIHTIAQEKYYEVYGKYFQNEKKQSAMNLSKVLEFCGLPNERINIVRNEIVKEGKVHNALEDCRLEGEALYRLKFGQQFFLEYSRYEIPFHLKKIRK